MRTILEAVVGSTLHGTSLDTSDTDLIGVVTEGPLIAMGFAPQDTWVIRDKPDGARSEEGDVDKTLYGLRKFLSLALKGNPTILLPLFAPEQFLTVCTREGEMLRHLAPKIVSKQVYGPFRGYMHSQHKRLMGEQGQKRSTRQELVDAHGFDTKYAGHIVRLGIQGRELLLNGRLTLPMHDEARRTVLDVREGRRDLDSVSTLISQLEADLDEALACSTLPEKPDYPLVEAWMVETYLRYWR